MSNLERTPEVRRIGGRSPITASPVVEVFAGREVPLGAGSMVRRLLPNLGRRLVGPWCFVDHYGPDDIADAAGMSVPPHPHIGLQTVSWLLDGEVHHRDSLGNDQLVRPGQLGLMTAGRGIAHAEHSPVPHPAMLHGVQLWVALPGNDRTIAPQWSHYADLPTITGSGLSATVIMGELDSARSPGTAYSPIVGVDLSVTGDRSARLPLEPDFEHAVLVMSGAITVEDVAIAPGSMAYLGSGRSNVRLAADVPSRVLLLGGEPFAEEIVMWWNFVARTGAEITAAREEWMTGTAFGDVTDAGDRVPAPELPSGTLKPGGSSRR